MTILRGDAVVKNAVPRVAVPPVAVPLDPRKRSSRLRGLSTGKAARGVHFLLIPPAYFLMLSAASRATSLVGLEKAGMAALGTFETCRPALTMSVDWGR